MSDFEERYQKKHKSISFLKSGMRIGGAGASLIMLLVGIEAVAAMAGFFVSVIFAEVLGIWEEMI